MLHTKMKQNENKNNKNPYMTASKEKKKKKHIPLWNGEQLWRHLWAEQSPKRTIAHTSVEIK